MTFSADWHQRGPSGYGICSDQIHYLNALGELMFSWPEEACDEKKHFPSSNHSNTSKSGSIATIYRENLPYPNLDCLFKIITINTTQNSDENNKSIYETEAGCGNSYYFRSTQWSPDGKRIAAFDADAGIGGRQNIMIISASGSTTTYPVKLPHNGGIALGNYQYFRWVSDQEILFFYTYDKIPEKFNAYNIREGIALLNLNTGNSTVLCDDLDRTLTYYSQLRSLIDQKCPNVHPDLWRLFGDAENPVYDPIIPPEQDRFYFYHNTGYGTGFCKDWIEGYDRKTGEKFHVYTYYSKFPCSEY